MPTSLSFTGAGLSPESAQLIAPATLRVRYTTDPLESSSTGANDALNSSNYLLSGPTGYSISSIISVSGDPQAVDILLVAPLAAGQWTIAVSNVQTATGSALVAPTSLQFISTGSSVQEPVPQGAKNSDAEEVIHKHANPALNTRGNKGWKALVAALATGDTTNWKNAQLAFDQLFKSSASSIYLDRRCADDGTLRPPQIGMPDVLFRKLAIRLSNNRVTQESLLEILEVFYGVDAVRAYVETTTTEPFSLSDQDSLQILTDERDSVPVTFTQGAFAQIGQASAIEVASAITAAFRAIKSRGYAVPFFDPSVNKYRVRIYSPSLGLGSAVRIQGGRAQNGLQFATPLSTIYTGVGALPTWAITFNAVTNTVRFTSTGTVGVDLSQLQVGDYVNVYGSEFLAANQGSFTVTNVSVTYPGGILTQYFEVINPTGLVQTLGSPQTASSDLLYFRPSKQTTQRAPTRAVVVSQGQGAAQVLMPATTAAVGRGAASGAYGQLNSPITATSIKRSASGLVTITAPSHGIPLTQTNAQILLDGAVPNVTAPSVTAGGAGTTAYGPASLVSDLTSSSLSTYRHVAVTLKNGDTLLAGGKNIGGSNTVQSGCSLLSITGSTAMGTGAVQYTYSWLSATSMTKAMWWASGILLTDTYLGGKVLICGGVDSSNNWLTDAYLYTSQTGGPGSWAATGSLSSARAGHGISTINNIPPTVLVTGGSQSNTSSTNSCEQFNPSTATWSPVSAMNIARCNHLQFTLSDGQSVLVCGGRQLGGSTLLEYTSTANMGTPLSSCELYQSGTWKMTGQMTYNRFAHGGTVLPDGRVLVVGGWGYNPVNTYGNTTPQLLTQAEIWDPNSGIWLSAGQLAVGREYPTVTYVAAQNRVYVTGGTSTLVEYLDVATMRWYTSLASLSSQHQFAAGTLTSYSGNPLIVLSGGLNGSGNTISADSLIIPASERISSGNLNNLVTATVVDANTLTYQTRNSDYSASSSASATWAAGSVSTIPGPHVFDPVRGAAITSSEANTTQDVYAGHRYSTITVDDATKFPDAPGYVCLAFGTSAMTFPVPYLGRQSSTALLLDFTFVMPRNVPSGSKITYLYQKSAWVPSHPEQVGSFYLTASASGRVAASNALDQAASSGFTLTKTIEYPGDRGLGNAGLPDHGNYKISDRVAVWGGDTLDDELNTARNS